MAPWSLKQSAHFSSIITVICIVTLSQGDAGDEGTRGRPLRREKRGWVWNQFFVLEEYAEDKPLYIGKLHSDLDNGDGAVKYILSGEGAGTTFTLDESTGDIHAVQRLDREMKEHYVLRAQATHRHTGHALEPESRFIVKIQDINDNEPKFPDGPYKATVPEMSPVGTSVIRVTATDADDPSYGNSARVVYSVVKGQPYFSVDRHTGEVRVSLPNMNREVKGEYEVEIEAKDMAGQMGGLAGTTTVNITLSDVNNNPPRFAHKVYQMSIPESAPVGSVVGHVEALDQDLGINAEMRYRVIDGEGRDLFDVGADSTNTYGVVTVKQHLDYETARSYTLKVEVANTHVDKRFSKNGLFSAFTTVHVSIEDVDEPPQFGSGLYYAEIREDAEIGTALITVLARDPDAANKSIRYMIDRASDPDQYFSVGVASGSLTTDLHLDREKIGWHNLTVIASETDNPLKTASISVAIRILDVNDNPPSIAHLHEVFLCASARAGQLVQSVRAVDADELIGAQHFRYTLALEAQINPNFTLIDNHDNSARVLTRRGGWESQSVYHLPITVSDGGEPVLSSTHTLTIRVCECDADGDVSSCRNAELHILPANLSMAALTTMLGCVSVVIVLLALILLVSSGTKKPFPSYEEENVRENIVHYDDEGGGEEDTVAFDMTKLWKTHTETLSYAELVLNGTKLQHAKDKDIKPSNAMLQQEKQPEIPSLSCYVTQMDAKKYIANANNSNLNSFMLSKLCEDLDIVAAASDSLQTFAYEGEGSVAESLSSLQSNDELELDYDYLDEWGPRFHTLAELYGTSQCNV